MDRQLPHPNWWRARNVIEALIPGIAELGHDDIPALADATWVAPDTDDRADEEIWQELRPQIADRLRGELVVITFASVLRGAGPLFVDAAELGRLVREHGRDLRRPVLQRRRVDLVA